MRDHRRFLDILKRADEDKAGLRLVDDQTNPFELDFPTVAPIADNDDLWGIEAPAEEVEMEEVSIEDKSLGQVVADLVLDEEEAIEGYEDAEEAVAASEEISEDEKDEILDILDHIKEEEEEHIDELTEIVSEEETEVDSENDTNVDDAADEESEDTEDSVEDELEEDLKSAENNEGSNYVFIDLSGSSYALKDALTAAAIADGHKKDEIAYCEDSRFADATREAKRGHNVFLYTKDDDYKVNSELEKFPNVKIKIISKFQEAAKAVKYSRKAMADMVATMVDGLEKQSERLLTESRSVVDIEAEIAKLQQELVDAKIAEKKASYGGNVPTEVWYWDIYRDPSEKGTWISLDFDNVYETKDAAINGAYKHLSELDYEDELEYDSDDYYVDAVKIPVSKVPIEALEWSGLDYLI